MENIGTTEAEYNLKYKINTSPKRSSWQCALFGQDIVLIPFEGNEPCWFHRKMQELCFGVKWTNNLGKTDEASNS